MVTETRKPIVKLYKRCKRKQHARCPGSFEDWSTCSCSCHTPKSAAAEIDVPEWYDSRPAADGIEETRAAVETAEEWIAAHSEIAAANAASVGELHADCKARGLPCGVTCTAHVSQPVNEAPAAGTWGRKGKTLRERCFTPCAEHRPANPDDLDGDHTASRTLRMVLSGSPTCNACADCNALTLATARAYAVSVADKDANVGLKLDGYNSTVTIPAKDIRAWRARPFKLATGPMHVSILRRPGESDADAWARVGGKPNAINVGVAGTQIRRGKASA